MTRPRPIIPGELYYSRGGEDDDPNYWLACLTRAEEGGEPHCYFVASARRPTLFCEACRPRAAPPAPSPEPEVAVAPDLSAPPWGAAAPIWEGQDLELGAAMHEFYEERAAIVEYLANMPRALAEHQAYAMLLRDSVIPEW